MYRSDDGRQPASKYSRWRNVLGSTLHIAFAGAAAPAIMPKNYENIKQEMECIVEIKFLQV